MPNHRILLYGIRERRLGLVYSVATTDNNGDNDWVFFRWDAHTTYDDNRGTHSTLRMGSRAELVAAITSTPYDQPHNEVNPLPKGRLPTAEAIVFLEPREGMPEDLADRLLALEAAEAFSIARQLPVLRYSTERTDFLSFRASVC